MHKELAEKLAVCLADTVTYKFLAQGYHWNVKGPMFPQFHDFFEELYEDAESAIDPLAENIRKLGYDAPFTLEDFSSLTNLHCNPVSGDPLEMAKNLFEVNIIIKGCMTEASNLPTVVMSKELPTSWQVVLTYTISMFGSCQLLSVPIQQ